MNEIKWLNSFTVCNEFEISMKVEQMGNCTASWKFNLNESCGWDWIRNKYILLQSSHWCVFHSQKKKICRIIWNSSYLNEMQQCGYGASHEMWLKGTRRCKQNFNIELQCKLKLVVEMFEIKLFACKMENRFCRKVFWRSSVVMKRSIHMPAMKHNCHTINFLWIFMFLCFHESICMPVLVCRLRLATIICFVFIFGLVVLSLLVEHFLNHWKMAMFVLFRCMCYVNKYSGIVAHCSFCEECFISNLSAMTAKFQFFVLFVHQSLVLCPSYVPEKVGIYQKWYSLK